MDYTYVIGPTLPKSGAVSLKIGHAGDPDKRLGELQTGNPEKLEVLARWPNKGEFAERTLHREFESFRALGGREWFVLPLAKARELIARKTAQEMLFIPWACSRCSKVIPTHKDDEQGRCIGTIEVDGVYKHQQYLRGVPEGQLPWEPAPKWEVVCAACSTTDDPDYWFCVERARTIAEFLHWLSHISGKGLYTECSNFGSLIELLLVREN